VYHVVKQVVHVSVEFALNDENWERFCQNIDIL